MLNAVGEPVFEFGVNHRNSVFWAPHGRFLCLAVRVGLVSVGVFVSFPLVLSPGLRQHEWWYGFLGSKQAENHRVYKGVRVPFSLVVCICGVMRLRVVQSDYAITSGWSPDSRWFITACVHPRMRVSNGYRIFKYNGTGPVIDTSKDVLLEATFRPSMPEMYPDRPASPGAVGPGLDAAAVVWLP
jgi:translation initiation factor 2A